MGNDHPKAIFGLGSEVLRSARTPSGFTLLEADQRGSLCGQFRLAAYKILLEAHTDAKLIIFGGHKPSRTDPEDILDEAAALKAILVKEYGVRAHRIRGLSIGLNTRENVLGIRTICQYLADEHSFTAVTNEYHVERLGMFFKACDVHVPITTAEDILREHDAQRWVPEIQRAQQDELYAERIRNEEQGLVDFNSNVYTPLIDTPLKAAQ